MERTLVIVKPDAMQRGLAGEILSRFERRGLKVVGLKLMRIDQALANSHYGEHMGKPFFDGLVQFITASPVIVAVLEGTNAIDAVRSTMGPTNPTAAGPGTIRGDLALELGRNMVHGSDSPDSARREIELFFKPDELLDYPRALDTWIFENV
jgi:nucleoside-diphosphate kinase